MFNASSRRSSATALTLSLSLTAVLRMPRSASIASCRTSSGSGHRSRIARFIIPGNRECLASIIDLQSHWPGANSHRGNYPSGGIRLAPGHVLPVISPHPQQRRGHHDDARNQPIHHSLPSVHYRSISTSNANHRPALKPMPYPSPNIGSASNAANIAINAPTLNTSDVTARQLVQAIRGSRSTRLPAARPSIDWAEA